MHAMFLHERIQQKLDEKKLKQADIARATGKSTAAVTKWLRGENTPKTESLKEIAKLLEVNDEWLLTGKGLPNQESAAYLHPVETWDDSTPLDDDEVEIPFFKDFSFACGAGESIEFHFDVINGKFPFPPSFFQRKHVDPKCMRIIKAKGDSMSDFIHDQDLVGIDISQTEIIDGEIYAVYFEGEGMIKQIFKEEGGKLVLHSLNPKYRDREVTEQNGLNFKVMGRQFWRAG